MSEVVLSTYTLQLIGPSKPDKFGRKVDQRSIMPGKLREAEENLTDLLPDGYRVEIKEWDQP